MMCGRSCALIEPLEPTSFSRSLNVGACSRYWPARWIPSSCRVRRGWDGVLLFFSAVLVRAPKFRPPDLADSSFPTTRNCGVGFPADGAGFFFAWEGMVSFHVGCVVDFLEEVI